MHDTEDKKWWVEYGARQEVWFVNEIAPKIGLVAELNPEKNTNPFAPDLLVDEDKKLADLKTQYTPFFKARELFPSAGLDPTYTVTFNKKDYERYLENYPNIHIIFWVNWQEIEYKEDSRIYRVKPLKGVWRCTLNDITHFIHAGAPLHEYKRRKDDDRGNAKDSYLLDLRKMECVYLL